MARFRMLSIDGGGIRGLIPARILDAIEQKTKKRIHELFDVIAGTSTGGILALALTCPAPDDPKRARFRAADLVELYKTDGPTIFAKQGFWRTVDALVDRVPFAPDLGRFLGVPRDEDLHDLFYPKYREKGRAEVLQKYLGTAGLRDALTRVFITSYDTDQRIPVFFVSRDTDSADDEYHEAVVGQVSMVDAALATSAAPTYFPPHRLKIDAPKRDYSLVDGGVFANNPAGLARSFLRRPTDDGDLIVSLGTGSMVRRYPYDEIRDWGAIQWASPTLKIMFDGQTEAVALAVRQMVPAGSYFRLQALLSAAGVADDLDDASAENVAKMETLAAGIIDSPDFRSLCAALSSS
jgi:predicted acylesterase/phospholipase RssA